MRFDGLDEDTEKLHEVLDSVGDIPQTQSKLNMEEFLLEQGVAPRVIGLADAGFANTAGTGKMANQSLARCIDADKSWEEDGEGDFRIKGGFGKIVEMLKGQFKGSIYLDW